MLRMFICCLFVILAAPTFVTMETVRSIINITGYVGETIELRYSSQTDIFYKELRVVSWMYLCQNDCSENATYVNVANCYQGSWESLTYGHQLEGNGYTCSNGIAYMRATQPGNFTYKCQEMNEDKTDVIKEVTFMITIHALDNPSISPCLANHSSSCVVDNDTLSNSIGIIPIVNRVIEGGDAIFECSLKDGHESGEKYKWRLSRHIESSRMSSTASSTLKISDVKFEDDGVIVRCIVDVSGTSFYSKALLRIRTEGGSSTTASYPAEAPTNWLRSDISNSTISTDLQYVPTDLESSGSTTKSLPPYLMLIIVVPVLFICTLCILAFVVAANPKTRRRCRQLTNKDSSVQGAIGLTRLESNARSPHSPTTPLSTPRRPSAAALPLPLTPSPKESSELYPEAMFGGPESSHQQIDHSGAMPSPRSLCQSPPLSALLTSASNCYHVYQGLEDEHHPLSTSSFGATSMPKCPIESKSSSTKTHKSGKSSTTQSLPPYEINRSVSLPSKKTSQHSCTGSPIISLTRKGSANDQPLPPIPKSPGSYDEQDTITESRLSMELPVAVIKPMIHGYASIQDGQQVHGDEGLSTPNAFGLHSPSATTTTNNVHEGYTGHTYRNKNLRKYFAVGEIEGSSRGSSLIPDCHTYALAGNYADENIAGTGVSTQSIYHTIDEEKSGTLLSVGRQPVRCADDATSAKRDSVSSNRHIYEMPVDNIAPEVNNQSYLAETTFYFTLESEKDRKSQDVTVEQSPT